MKTERILMATDFSPRSLAALERTIDLAREHDSEIVLVHVIESLPYGVGHSSDPTKLLEHLAEDGRNQLAGFTKRALSLYPKCTSELHFGIVHQVISELARKLDIDLIRGGGSLAARIARKDPGEPGGKAGAPSAVSSARCSGRRRRPERKSRGISLSAGELRAKSILLLRRGPLFLFHFPPRD